MARRACSSVSARTCDAVVSVSEGASGGEAVEKRGVASARHTISQLASRELDRDVVETIISGFAGAQMNAGAWSVASFRSTKPRLKAESKV